MTKEGRKFEILAVVHSSSTSFLRGADFYNCTTTGEKTYPFAFRLAPALEPLSQQLELNN